MTSAAGNAHGAGLQPERRDAVDDAIDLDAATRTSTPAPEAPAQLDSPANHVGEIAPARLPAPLQYRDPARYDILGEHGRGGLGRVFRARDREMGRDVAVKELLNRGASSELRFFREALITARLEHPGIVPVHEAGRWPDGTPFYAMKLVAGRPLKVLFENATTVEARLALLPNIIAVADAIAYAHDRKIIHRDLKPANVIVGEYGETVVIDWGLAKDISPEAEGDDPTEDGPYRTAAPTPGVTVVGSVLGTPAYMAPEQARGELVDERADVYAIGAMLFQVCTGEKTPPTDVYKLHHTLGRSGVDVDLVSIVRKACAPEAGGRYRDAGKLAADLRAFAAGARVLARHYSAGALVKHWVKRHRKLAAAVAVMVVTVGVVGIVAFARVKEERDRAEMARGEQTRIALSLRESQVRLVLQNAELQLALDPTETIATLAAQTFVDNGNDAAVAAYLRAKATAAGVAVTQDQSAADTVHFLARMRDGTIVALAEDRTLRAIRPEGAVVLDSHYDGSYVFAFAKRAEVLVYPSDQGGLVVHSLARGPEKILDVGQVTALAINDNATQVAAIVDNELLTLELAGDAPPRPQHVPVPGAKAVAYRGPDELAVASATDIFFYSLKMGPSVRASLPTLSDAADVTALIAGSIGAIVGRTNGQVVSVPATGKAQVMQVCGDNAAVTDLAYLGLGRGDFVVACYDGTLDIVERRPGSGQEYLIRRIATQSGPFFDVATTEDGRRVVAAGAGGTTWAIELKSGSAGRLSGLADIVSTVWVSATGDDILSGDAAGTVRLWQWPSAQLTPVWSQSERMFAMDVLSETPVIGTVAGDIMMPLGRPPRAVRRVHDGPVEQLRSNLNGDKTLSVGQDGLSVVWSPDLAPIAKLQLPRGSVVDASFDDRGRVLLILRNGTLVDWLPGERAEHLTALKGKAVGIESLGGRTIVAGQSEFARIDADGRVAETVTLPSTVGDITIMVSQPGPDAKAIYLGTSEGIILRFDVRSAKGTAPTVVGKIKGKVRHVAVSPQDDRVAVVEEEGVVTLFESTDGRYEKRFAISMVAAFARFSLQDGRLFVAGTDGTITVYDERRNHWAAYSTRHTPIAEIAFASDGSEMFGSQGGALYSLQQKDGE